MPYLALHGDKRKPFACGDIRSPLPRENRQFTQQAKSMSILVFAKRISALFALTVLSACQGGSILPSLQTQVAPLPKPEIQKLNPNSVAPNRTLSEKVDGQIVGNGPIRVALLVPQSAQDGAGKIGKQLANAARIAIRDFGAGKMHLVVKDTKGNAAHASLLAEQARNEGASLILGPLFSANVSTASGISKPANLPMIAFSSDLTRAADGVYLMSFAPAADIRRTLNYGISLGANRVVAFLPKGAYGVLAEREMRLTLDQAQGQIVQVVHYGRDTNSIITAARSVSLAIGNANGIYIPDGGEVPLLILKSLQKSGVSLAGKQIMGSGQWDSVKLNHPILNGAIYAGADKRNFTSFARRYRATYGTTPTTTAAVAYDAVSLAADLIRRNSQNPFTRQAIQSPSGFNGVTGIFRFKANGHIQRGLVVYQTNNGQRIIASPAPTSFGVTGS